jgi:hypothetical protein
MTSIEKRLPLIMIASIGDAYQDFAGEHGAAAESSRHRLIANEDASPLVHALNARLILLNRSVNARAAEKCDFITDVYGDGIVHNNTASEFGWGLLGWTKNDQCEINGFVRTKSNDIRSEGCHAERVTLNTDGQRIWYTVRQRQGFWIDNVPRCQYRRRSDNDPAAESYARGTCVRYADDGFS